MVFDDCFFFGERAFEVEGSSSARDQTTARLCCEENRSKSRCRRDAEIDSTTAATLTHLATVAQVLVCGLFPPIVSTVRSLMHSDMEAGTERLELVVLREESWSGDPRTGLEVKIVH